MTVYLHHETLSDSELEYTHCIGGYFNNKNYTLCFNFPYSTDLKPSIASYFIPEFRSPIHQHHHPHYNHLVNRVNLIPT